ncbi:hypothetical protein ACMATS_00115 [Streptoverticillium reticulum]|uniref:hypothetical protein n=1 Tax=Streptoverticillium reticulum TaxID=1433415 RepID=UPI0039BEDC30
MMKKSRLTSRVVAPCTALAMAAGSLGGLVSVTALTSPAYAASGAYSPENIEEAARLEVFRGKKANLNADWQRVYKILQQSADSALMRKAQRVLYSGAPVQVTSSLPESLSTDKFFVASGRTETAVKKGMSGAVGREGRVLAALTSRESAEAWVNEVNAAYRADESDLQTAARFSPMIPMVGNVLGLAAGIQANDSVQQASSVSKLLIAVVQVSKIFGAGPSAVLAAAPLIINRVATEYQEEEALRDAYDKLVEQRDQKWNDFLTESAREVDSSYAEALFAFLKGQAIQAATAKAFAAMAVAQEVPQKSSRPRAYNVAWDKVNAKPNGAKEVESKYMQEIPRVVGGLRAGISSEFAKYLARAWPGAPGQQFRDKYVAYAKEMLDSTKPKDWWGRQFWDTMGHKTNTYVQTRDRLLREPSYRQGSWESRARYYLGRAGL